MNSEITYQVLAKNAEQTQRLGRFIGQSLQGGLVIRLFGNLGAGKTCLVQGLAKGLEIPEDFAITSPTYTLINEYPGRLALFHADLYRIHSSEDAEAIGFYDILTPNNVVAVEWAERLADSEWPSNALAVHIQTQTDEIRQIRLIGSGLQITNLIKQVGALWDRHSNEAALEIK